MLQVPYYIYPLIHNGQLGSFTMIVFIQVHFKVPFDTGASSELSFISL